MTDRDEFYNALVDMLRANTLHLSDALGWMAYHSQSVILNYGEDSGLWECSWIISSGKRFCSAEKTPLQAIKAVLSEVSDETD